MLSIAGAMLGRPSDAAYEALHSMALLNLCVNARAALPNGGRLRLAAHNLELDARSAVMQRGIGPGRHVVVEVAEGCS